MNGGEGDRKSNMPATSSGYAETWDNILKRTKPGSPNPVCRWRKLCRRNAALRDNTVNIPCMHLAHRTAHDSPII